MFGDTSLSFIGPWLIALRNRVQEAGPSEVVNVHPGSAQGTSEAVAHVGAQPTDEWTRAQLKTFVKSMSIVALRTCASQKSSAESAWLGRESGACRGDVELVEVLRQRPRGKYSVLGPAVIAGNASPQ